MEDTPACPTSCSLHGECYSLGKSFKGHGGKGAYFISNLFQAAHPVLETSREMLPLGEGGRDGGARVWAAVGTAQHTAAPLHHRCGARAEPQGDLLPTSHLLAAPHHSTLPSCWTPGWWGTGMVPLLPAPLQRPGKMGIKYKVTRKKVWWFFFFTMHLSNSTYMKI